MSIEIKKGETISVLPTHDAPDIRVRNSRFIIGTILHVSCTTIVLKVTWWHYDDKDLKGKIINIRFSDIMGFEPA